jgi:glucokinase
MKVYALDIGGSSIKHALVDVSSAGAVIIDHFSQIQLSTRLFSDLREALVITISDVVKNNSDISTVAISTTGNVDQNGMVRRAGHFIGYENVLWSHILCNEFPSISHIKVVNDGKASTWAEFSSLKEHCETFAHVVVGTGIGGGMVIKRELFYGDEGSAGSFGHIKVYADTDIPCSCTRVGCVETVASAPAIIRAYKLAKNDHTDMIEPNTLEDIAVLAKAGDENALAVFIKAGEWLGVALSNVMNIINPQVVTIGGGVVLAAESIQGGTNIFLDAAQKKATSLALKRVAAATSIRRAMHGNDSGLLGAAMLSCSL